MDVYSESSRMAAAFPKFPERLRASFAVLVVFAMLLVPAASQTAPQSSEPAKQSSSQQTSVPQQAQPSTAKASEQAPQQTASTPVTDTEPSKPITKAEAKALFRRSTKSCSS